MTPELWQRLKPLFHAALEEDPQNRAAFIEGACAGDLELKRHLEQLLDSEQQDSGSLDVRLANLKGVLDDNGGPLQQGDLRMRGIIRLTMALVPGTKLDGYEVIELLGAGGMGEVYRARDAVLKREVAIKVLPAFVSQDPDRLRRFEQEAQATAALNHPNILAIHRFGVFEGAPYLVSELLVGDTLRQQLERGPLPIRKAIEYGIQIAHGLAAAHDKGVVHRDLKPENLFVTKEGRIKILDFGLAKLMQRHPDGTEPTQANGTEAGLVMGTVGYMSPEQVRGITVDHRADIFAFGAILYEMLAGKRAFQRPTSAETMSAILNEDPPGISQIVQTIPLGLQRVVRRCLEKSPEQRFQSASDLAFALDAISDSGISSAVGIEAPSERRRSKALAWSVGLAAVLAVAVATYFFATRHERAPFEHYSLQRVIDSKHVRSLAISPDGIYLVAIVSDANGAQSLLLHHLPTNSERTIVQDAAYKFHSVTFSPDGSYIYFRIDALGTPKADRWDDYRIPVLGGQPTRVIADVVFPLSFIDGGQRVCFYRQDVPAGTYQLLSANASGGEEQVLANGKKPFPTLAVCAPDGRSAVVENELGDVESLDFGSGSMRMLASSTALGGYLDDMRWTPDGKGLFTTSWERNDFAPISFLSYPGGKLRRITNDLSVYSGISLTADAKTIATTQTDVNARFAELSVVEPSYVQEHQTGELVWFTWLDNDKIVADGAGKLRLVSLPKDETSMMNVAKGHLFGQPSMCGPDTLVLIGSTLEGDIRSVYTMHLDGSGLTQLTKGPRDFFPECTADGKWVYYADDRDQNNPLLMRQSLQGGAAQKVAQARIWFNISPDGRLLAIAAAGAGAPLQVLSMDSLRVVRSFPPRGFDDFDLFAFSADSKSVFYVTRSGADATIWRQPLDAAAPTKVAALPGKAVNWMRPSPDGTKLGLILETPTSEAVLLRDVR
jgi:serine/threonine protein kinase